jgi:hypothetical protein
MYLLAQKRRIHKMNISEIIDAKAEEHLRIREPGNIEDIPCKCWLKEGCNGDMSRTLTLSICNKCGRTSQF